MLMLTCKLAHSVEHIHKENRVAGSSPASATKKRICDLDSLTNCFRNDNPPEGAHKQNELRDERFNSNEKVAPQKAVFATKHRRLG